MSEITKLSGADGLFFNQWPFVFNDGRVEAARLPVKKEGRRIESVFPCREGRAALP